MGGHDMRLSKTIEVLNTRLTNTIRRSYPLIGSESIQESYDLLTDPKSTTNNLTREPWIEALPKYEPFAGGFSGLRDSLSGKDKRFVDFLENMYIRGRGDIFPPYTHQAASIKAWSESKDFVVSTGTGSGKTECFLYPILGHLHNIASRQIKETKESGEVNSLRGIKAIVLYPMNALVGDQLKRMRTLLGDWELANALCRDALHQGGKNRFFQFGSYTGRTRFAGAYAFKTKQGRKNPKVNKNGSARNYVEKFVELERGDKTGPHAGESALYLRMMEKGLVPAKGRPKFVDLDGKKHEYWSLEEFLNEDGKDQLITHHDDRELLMRHEMHNVGYNFLQSSGQPRINDTINGGGTPDVLITNYSMLEYMLKRPLEHIMFRETREWLNQDPENKLLLVLDEAHLYQGALGTEIGMLLRRLRMTLGIAGLEDKVQFILTSASLGKVPKQKTEFVKGLTGRTDNWFDEDKTEFIEGVKWSIPEPDDNLFDYKPEEWKSAFRNLDVNCSDMDIWKAATHISNAPQIFDNKPETVKKWFNFMRHHSLYKKLYKYLGSKTRSISELARELFGADEEIELKCSEIILNFVASLEGETNIPKLKAPLLGIRAHLLYRGLTEFYWNLSKDVVQSTSTSSIFSHDPEAIYPLYSCRRCGGGYAQVFINSNDENGTGSDTEKILKQEIVKTRTYNTPYPHTSQIELYLCDSYNGDITTKILSTKSIEFKRKPDIFLHKNLNKICTLTYFQNASDNEKSDILSNWKPGYLPKTGVSDEINVPPVDSSFRDSGCESRYTFNRSKCMQCQSDHSRRQSDQITSLMTRGDQAFSSLTLGLHQSQDGDSENILTPNRGKKVLIFSDGRQRAARMAKTIQDFANNDELRISILHLLNDEWYQKITDLYSLSSLEQLYQFYVIHITAAMQDPFEESASYFSPREMFANNREAILSHHIAGIGHIVREDGIEIKSLGLETNSELRYFISKFDDTSVTDSHLARAEQFTNPTNVNLLGDMEEYTQFFNKKSPWTMLRYVQDKIMIENLINENKSIDTLTEFGIILELVSENFSEGEDDLPPIDKDKLKEKFQEAEIGRTTDDYIDPLLSRWNTLRIKNSNDVKDDDLQDFFQENDKNFARNKSYLKSRREKTREVFKYIIQNLQEVEIYDQMVQKSLNLLRTDFNSLSDYAQLSLQIKDVETDFIEYADPNGKRLLRKYVFGRIIHYLRSGASTPQFFFTQLIDFISSRDFSLEDLGLGRLEVIDKKYDLMINKLEEEFVIDENLKQLDGGLPLRNLIDGIARFPIMSHQNYKLNETGKDSSRGIKDTLDNFTVYAARDHPREYILKKKPDKWGATSDQIKKYLSEVLEIQNPPFNVLKLSGNDAVNIIGHNLSNLRSSPEGRYQTKAEDVRIVNMCMNEDDFLMCTRCGSTLMHKTDIFLKRCNKCGADSKNDILPYDKADPLIKLRIEDPWREPARKAMKSTTKDMKITLVRAEEHTAQINDPTNLDDMYSHAERFEMLFQDLPLITPNENNPFSTPEAPIDILSCTTTMEVGIDIGSLTAVALRTVPRERANYQQRVGRAGRGKAEVCVALSWYDNKPYAQHYFANPNNIIDHPDNSPIIYLENIVIIQRHIWAAIMQRFFKRLKFDTNNRVFFGMDAEQQKASLMDSMGTKDAFMESTASTSNLYCLEALKKWINDDDAHITLDCNGNDMRNFSWCDSIIELSELLPENLYQSVKATNSDGKIITAKSNTQVIKIWAKELVKEFDNISLKGSGAIE